MQEQRVFLEKYNFVKFELERIKSLWGLKKEHAEQKSSYDISIGEIIKEIFSELKLYAFKPCKKLLLAMAICGVLSGITPYLRMLYMGELPELLNGTTKAIIIFSCFMAMSELNGYLLSIFSTRSRFIQDEMMDLYDNSVRAKNYVEILHKPRALFNVNGVEGLLAMAESIFRYKRFILDRLFISYKEFISLVVCTASLFAIVPQLALFILLLQFISMEFALYNNKFFRRVDERFRLFSAKVYRENGGAKC